MRFKAVVIKEFLHIFRDPRSLTIILVMPVFLIIVYGYSISFDLNRIDTAIIDYSNSRLSGELYRSFSSNGYYHIRPLATGIGKKGFVEQAEFLLKRGEIDQYIIIPGDYSNNLTRNLKTQIGIIIDGSDANKANLIYQFNDLVLLKYSLKLKNLKHIFNLHTHVYFNPDNKSSFFLIPGLVAILLLLVSASLTSVSIAREKETGSIDLLFISPLRSLEIILGKTIPYMVVAISEGILILAVAKFWFNIPIRGNLLVLFIFATLYVLTGLAFGILISTATSSQRVAMLASFLATMLPSILLSGFIFPLNSLSPLLRAISQLVPATYFLKIIRGIVLKGATMEHLFVEGMLLLGISMFLLTVATLKFTAARKKSRDK